MTGPTVRHGPVRRLHLNECPHRPSPAVIQAIANAAEDANRYPAADDPAFYDALSAYTGAPADRLAATAGSNELLHILPLIANAHGAELVVPDPSFPTYVKVAAFHNITVHAVPVRPDGRPDIDAMLAAITPHTRLVCVPSPNNPTGGLLNESEIRQLASGVPDSMLLHFDEAYYEFGRHAGGVDALAILRERKGPWISSRSFSKAFGLAGIRLGYAIASDASLASRIRTLRPNFCVNALAWAAGRAALFDRDHAETLVSATAEERDRLASGLKALKLSPLPSAANFVAFPAPADHGDLASRLEAEGILVTPFTMPENRPAIRISIGTADDTDAVLAALANHLDRP